MNHLFQIEDSLRSFILYCFIFKAMIQKIFRQTFRASVENLKGSFWTKKTNKQKNLDIKYSSSEHYILMLSPETNEVVYL